MPGYEVRISEWSSDVCSSDRLSPALAAVLLMVLSFHVLFAGTAVGFVLSALLVLGTALPAAAMARVVETPYARALRGMRIYLHTPRLRALLALNLVAADRQTVVAEKRWSLRGDLGGDR